MCGEIHFYSGQSFRVFYLGKNHDVGFADSDLPKLTKREIIFEEFQPMWLQSTNATDLLADRRADGETTYRWTTALCVALRGKSVIPLLVQPVLCSKFTVCVLEFAVQHFSLLYNTWVLLRSVLVAEWYGTRLAIARSWVPLLPVHGCCAPTPTQRVIPPRLMSTSESWWVNGHTTRCTGPVSVGLQLRLVSGWGLQEKEISAALYGPLRLGKGLYLLLVCVFTIWCCIYIKFISPAGRTIKSIYWNTKITSHTPE